MYLKQKRICTSKKLLSNIAPKQKFFLGVELSDKVKNILDVCFNISDLAENTAIFPSPIYGIMSRRNAVGEFIPQKNLPKETAYRALSWEITDWGGYSHSGISYVPYKRYPRKYIEPKELKLFISSYENGKKILIIDTEYSCTKENDNEIIFGANLLLEIFGEVNTFTTNKENKIIEPTETLNWKILPKGEKIWNAFNGRQNTHLSISEQHLITERFNYIQQFQPDVVRQGIGGYTGYLIFEFTQKNLFIFDSIMYGDAMYVFEDDWEAVSKLNKKEIIQEQLAKERIIHNNHWKSKLKKHLI